MKFELEGILELSASPPRIEEGIRSIVDRALVEIRRGEDQALVRGISVEGNKVRISLESHGRLRAHEALLRLRKILSEELGRTHRVGVRSMKVHRYRVEFDLPRPPRAPFHLPLVHSLEFDQSRAILELRDVPDEYFEENYVDRMIRLVREKVEAQYYEGKGEYHEILWSSPPRDPLWRGDPTLEMLRRGWVVQGPTKGKWVFRPPAAALLRAMERIAVEEVLLPLGFQEIVIPHHVPFDVWMKSGHIHGVPNEIYYVCEPRTRDVGAWQEFIDEVKITRKVPLEKLQSNLSPPSAGIDYAQCTNIYWSFQGKTLPDSTLPLLLFDRSSVSNRYESGGRHGIERLDEFHRIEPVYIGKKEHLLEIREKLIERYRFVFNEILELEWRMAWVTPFFLAQEGQTGLVDSERREVGTIDFEAWLPYRGSREESEWLEFQNLSIVGTKYTEAFTIKGQRGELWSGCSGIGLERWTAAFLAQKGLDPEGWPEGFRKYLPRLPPAPEFL